MRNKIKAIIAAFKEAWNQPMLDNEPAPLNLEIATYGPAEAGAYAFSKVLTQESAKTK